MKCPRCHKRYPQNARFCADCGVPLEAVPAGGGSKAKKAVLAILKALCYIFVMVGVQNLISTAFLVYAMIADGSLLSYAENPAALTAHLNELLYSNLTMILLVANLVTILVISLFFTLRRKNPLEEVMLRPVSWRILPLCALYGVALNIFIAVTLSLLPIPSELLTAVDDQYAGLMGNSNVVLEILSTAVLTGTVEEVIFRGLTISRLKKGMNRAVAIGISAVIFGLFHGTLLAVCYATVLGVVFGILAERYGSILPCVICHMFFNVTNFFLVTDNGFVILALYFISIAVLIVGSYLLFRRTHTDEQTDAVK